MDYKELIEELKKYTYWLGRDEPCSHDIHPVICDEAATAIETLLVELDAAVEEFHGRCSRCEHFHSGIIRFPCTDCKFEAGSNDRWKWRGLTKGV